MRLRLDRFRRSLGGFLVAVVLCCAPFAAAQSTTPNTQDVPKQTPGTNNPDVSKDHQPTPEKPTPGKPKSGTGQPQEADVPEQQPGTNNPDVAKDHKNQQPSTGKNQKAHKKAEPKTGTSR